MHRHYTGNPIKTNFIHFYTLPSVLITKENICVKVCKTKVNNIILICKENAAEVAPQIVQPSYTELSRTQRGVYQGISAVDEAVVSYLLQL